MAAEIFTLRDIAGQRKHMWDSRVIENEVNACYRRRILGVFMDYLPKEGQILEAGCGLGAWVLLLGRMGYKIKGIDIDENVINAVKKYDPKSEVSVGDVCRLNLEDNSLSSYISLGVVEHFREGPQNALNEARRVLQDNGIIILTVPYNSLLRRAVVHPLRKIYLWIWKLKKRKVHFAEYRYAKNEFIDLVKDAGFSVEFVGTDDFVGRAFSFGVWSDFPFLRGKREYELNVMGKIFSFIIKLFPRWFSSSGILVVGKKKDGK